jgi:hypothetical protein
MHCPYCDVDGSRQVIHAHLTDTHGDKVIARRDEQTDKLFYRLDCPRCDEYSEREVNPRGRDPTFLQAFEREIRLVAFDLLLYHIEDMHS